MRFCVTELCYIGQINQGDSASFCIGRHALSTLQWVKVLRIAVPVPLPNRGFMLGSIQIHAWRLGNVWDHGKYPFFLWFVGRVSIRKINIQTVASLTSNSHIDFSGVQFNLPKKEYRLLKSGNVDLCPKIFLQFIQCFCRALDYQLSANSIYKDKEDFFLWDYHID